MSQFSLAALHDALDAIPVTTLSLHTYYSNSGGFEIAGGSPPYTRIGVTFNAAGAVSNAVIDYPYAKGISYSTAPPAFNVPPGITVAWFGMWARDGTFLGMAPIGGDQLRMAISVDPSSNTFISIGHNFISNDTVVIWGGGRAPLPGGVTEGTTYYVLNPTNNGFQLATQPNGDAISLRFAGNGFFQRITPVSFISQATLDVTIFQLNADVVSTDIGIVG